MKTLLAAFVFAVALGTSVSNVQAHAFFGTGFIAGTLHPIGGWDHALAMLAVGIIGAQLGGKWTWVLPIGFVCAMAFGGLLGFQHVTIIWPEHLIVASVVVLGALLTLPRPAPGVLALTVALLFGTYHGYAHGIELPATSDALYFTFGFLLTTFSLHATGIFLGLIYRQYAHSVRYFAASGIVLIAAGAMLGAQQLI